MIWIKFYDPKIGHQQAKKLASLYSCHISKDWIPILRIARPISIIEKTRHLKIRKHFLVQLACAHTMHRSQGLTLDNVAFDSSGIRKNGLVYTDLSCVRNMQSLYLLNALTKDNFRVKEKIASEMERLKKDAKWELGYYSQSINLDSSISILSLNTRNLQAHIDDVLNDYDLMQSDILRLQETYLKNSMLKEKFISFNFISNFSKHGVMTCFKKHIMISESMHFEEENVEAKMEI